MHVFLEKTNHKKWVCNFVFHQQGYCGYYKPASQMSSTDASEYERVCYRSMQTILILSEISFNVVVLRAKHEVYFTGNILQTEPVSGEQTVLLDVSLWRQKGLGFTCSNGCHCVISPQQMCCSFPLSTSLQYLIYWTSKCLKCTVHNEVEQNCLEMNGLSSLTLFSSPITNMVFKHISALILANEILHKLWFHSLDCSAGLFVCLFICWLVMILSFSFSITIINFAGDFIWGCSYCIIHAVWSLRAFSLLSLL